MDYAAEWFKHDLKPTDVVHILTTKGPYGLRVWRECILGDLILTEPISGLILSLPLVSEFDTSLPPLYRFAFTGEGKALVSASPQQTLIPFSARHAKRRSRGVVYSGWFVRLCESMLPL